MSSPAHVSNLLAAYRTLADRVNTSLFTQLGDTQRLNVARSEVISFARSLDEVKFPFPQRLYV